MKIKPIHQLMSPVELIIQARHIERVRQAVEEAGSVSRAARPLRMSEEEINQLLSLQKK